MQQQTVDPNMGLLQACGIHDLGIYATFCLVHPLSPGIPSLTRLSLSFSGQEQSNSVGL